MPTNNSINGIHAQRLKEIRPFITFNYDLRTKLSASNKRTIKKYHDAINQLTARPNRVFRPRRRDHLKTAKQFAQHPKGLPGLKVAFIPLADKDAKIVFDKKRRLVVKTRHVSTHDIQFDFNLLVDDPVKHINDLVNEHPNAKAFTIKADEHEIPGSFSRSMLSQGVIELMEKYGEVSSNNYFGNWLFGAKAHTFKNQSDFNSFTRVKEKKRNELKRARDAARKRK